MFLYLSLIIGFVLSFLFPWESIQSLPGYELMLYSLLGIGLYGAVHGIDLKEFHNHKALIFRAVTVGVLLKSILIGAGIWLLFQSPYAFLLAIIVSQIDPLSVAHLVEEKTTKFSTAGRTILRAWSSFDDPMTVLLGLYIYLPLTVVADKAFTPESYLSQLLLNLLFAFVVWIIGKSIAGKRGMEVSLLGIAFVVAVIFQLMLGIALIGLFLRPSFKHLPQLVHACFILAAILLGSLLEIQITSILYGLSLGILAWGAHAIVTPLVAPKLQTTDKLFLSFAQYNGITSIILALIFAQWIPEVVSIIAFAVITINTLYYATNHFLEKRIR